MYRENNSWTLDLFYISLEESESRKLAILAQLSSWLYCNYYFASEQVLVLGNLINI